MLWEYVFVLIPGVGYGDDWDLSPALPGADSLCSEFWGLLRGIGMRGAGLLPLLPLLDCCLLIGSILTVKTGRAHKERHVPNQQKVVK